MISNFLRVSEKELGNYLNNSALLEDKIYNETINIEDDANYLDIDKSWGGIFYVLTGCSLEEMVQAEEPFSWIIFGDERIDEDQDLGYGPAGYLTAVQVKDISKELNKTSTEDFKARFNPDDMTEKSVYPEIWNEGDEALEYLTINFEKLKELYNQAAINNQAVITYIN